MARYMMALLILSVTMPLRSHQSDIRSVEGRILAPLNAYLPVDAVVVLMDRTETILTRQHDQPVPESAQVVGDLLLRENSAEFRITLPPQPGRDVRVFTVEIAQNYRGDRSLHPVEQRTEQGVIAWRSIITSETQPDLLGGALIVYAPEAGITFAGGRGSDGRLFTADDPLLVLPEGYSIVHLEDPSVRVSQTEPAELALHPIAGLLPVDLRGLSYGEAFDHLIELLRTRYAYTDLYGVNWLSLHANYRSAVIEGDPVAFYQLLAEMGSRIPDRHVFAAPEPPLVQVMNPDLDLTAVDTGSLDVLSTEFMDGYAMARLRSFAGGRQTITQWETFITEARSQSVDGIVVDLTGAAGGDGALAAIMAAYFFADQPAYSFEDFRLSRFDSTLGEFSPVVVSSGGFHAPNPAQHFSGPVAILVSPTCASACELFTYLLRSRAMIAGSGATAGAGGAMTVVRMPGDVSFFYTFLRADDGSGQPAWESRGITPEIMLDPQPLNDAALAALFGS